jgi:hypothetical protein
MVHEIKDLSGQREEVSNKLINAVVKDLLINIQDAKQERKKVYVCVKFVKRFPHV